MCEEGGVGEGRSTFVISPGGGNFECVSYAGVGGGGGGGHYDKFLLGIWRLRLRTPSPLLLGFDRLCSVHPAAPPH